MTTKRENRGRNPTFLTEEETIHHFIGLYYRECESNEKLRYQSEDHWQVIEHLNERYRDELKRHKDFDFDKYQEAFMQNIDFLTKAITKRKAKIEKAEEKKRFMQELQKR